MKPERTRLLVINADDFGLTDGVCRAIRELFELKAISSTSLMTAALDAPETMERWGVKELAGCAGVHLQLTGGRPVSPHEAVPDLIDPQSGRFRDPRNLDRVPDPDQVEIEWRNQVALATELLGAPPSHLDSHHGMHRIPEYTAIYIRLAKELGVGVRGAQGELGVQLREMRLSCSLALVRRWSGSSQSEVELDEQVKSLAAEFPSERAIEVITHPAYVDDHLRKVSSLAGARFFDFKGLANYTKSGLRREAGFDLGTYRDFLPPHGELVDG